VRSDPSDHAKAARLVLAVAAVALVIAVASRLMALNGWLSASLGIGLLWVCVGTAVGMLLRPWILGRRR
jgi:hypothetical protein